MNGLFSFNLIELFIYTIVVTHITIVAVTIYLHRCQSHRAIELNPIISHFFRAWLWLTTGMITKEWVAVHRKHHACVDTPADPHSPIVQGLPRILWQGVIPYRQAARDFALCQRFGTGTPEDWLERNIYTPYPWLGVLSMLVIDVTLFGVYGLIIWTIQMAWIPFLAAGVVNGIGHYFGYRNYDTADHSTNFFPIGLLIGGEELHNNHHASPYAANLARRWFELDIGFLYIRILSMLKLAKIKYMAQPLSHAIPELKRWSAIQINQYKLKLLAQFNREVIPGFISQRMLSGRLQKILKKSYHRLSAQESLLLDQACLIHPVVKELLDLKLKLYEILHSKTIRTKSQHLVEWCQSCQQSNVAELINFSKWLESLLLGETHYA